MSLLVLEVVEKKYLTSTNCKLKEVSGGMRKLRCNKSKQCIL